MPLGNSQNKNIKIEKKDQKMLYVETKKKYKIKIHETTIDRKSTLVIESQAQNLDKCSCCCWLVVLFCVAVESCLLQLLIGKAQTLK